VIKVRSLPWVGSIVGYILGDVVLRFMDKSSQDDRRENVRFL